MKRSLIPMISMLWLALLLPAGHGQSERHSARQQKQKFIYVLWGRDVRLYRVQKDGVLRVVYLDYIDIGRFPRCIAATPDGRTLYISTDTEGNDYHSGQIYEFAIKKNGDLSSLGGIKAGTLPLVMAMTKSGSFLYCAAEDGVTRQSLLYQYRVEANGSLSALKPPTINLGKNLFPSLVVSPSNKYLYISTYVFTAGKPVCFRITHSGALVRLPTSPTQDNVETLALSPSGRYVYCLQSGGVISVAAVDPHTGSFSELRPVAHVPPASYTLAVNPQRNTVQITNAFINAKNIMTTGPVSEFQILPNGDLKPSVPPTFPEFTSYTKLAPNSRQQFVSVTRFP